MAGSMDATSGNLLRIQRVIDDLKERIHRLRNFDAAQEINSYCDDLESEVVLTTESAIKHLNELEKEMLKEINDYRHGLLLATQLNLNDISEVVGVTEELSEISNKIDQLSSQITAQLNQPCLSEASDPLALEAQGNELAGQVREAQKKVRSRKFKESFLSFQPNRTFLIERHHLGQLAKHSNGQVSQMPSQSKL